MPVIKPFISFFLGLALLATPAIAQEVWITQELPFVEVEVGDDFFVIEREQDNAATVTASFAQTSRPCPPFCVQPMSVADGVETIGELELITFIEEDVQSGTGLLIDARTSRWYVEGTIPGSISLPFNLMTPSENNPFLKPVLIQLGGELQDDGSWSFTNAPKLALFCNGPWCGQSPRAIENLLLMGYPAEKLLYYRGGMQSWLMLGLTTIVPDT
ncbi:MAG: rhodanese-like domain-containing protein [Rhodobacteraceae bacterium]|nr:rhodanese-like domain-containing protein [Paracoccaceae bacterium]